MKKEVGVNRWVILLDSTSSKSSLIRHSHSESAAADTSSQREKKIVTSPSYELMA